MNPSFYRDLITGRSRGVAAEIARGALATASLFYGGAVCLRNRAFDRRIFPVQRAAVPVISVGNLTAGGTGKTPVVAAIVEWFSSRGVRPVILSRGYRAHAGAVNDEKLVLDQQCPGVPHLQGADRVETARTAVEQNGAQVLILDDAFQHRRLARNLDLVLIDSLDPWGGGNLLPRGLLREPRSALRRADAVLLTRADQCASDEKAKLIAEVCANGSNEPPIEIAFRPGGLMNFAGAHAPIDSAILVAAFCGIGNPEGFRKTLAASGLANVVGFRAFRDHHHYTDADFVELASWARSLGAQALVTTQKDLVKIPHDTLDKIPLWCVPIRAEIIEGVERFDSLLTKVLPQTVAPNVNKFQ